MKRFRRFARTLILALLLVSLFVPTFLLSGRLVHLNSRNSEEVIEDLTSMKYSTDALKLDAVVQEGGGVLRKPSPPVYEDKVLDSRFNFSSSDESHELEESEGTKSSVHLSARNETDHDANGGQQQSQQEKVSAGSTTEEFDRTKVQNGNDSQSRSRRLNDRLNEIKDQLVRANAYLNFTARGRNTNLAKELKLRIRELEQDVGEATKDADLPRRAVQRMKSMEALLLRASRIYPDCSAMDKKLRSMTYKTEVAIKAQKKQVDFLFDLAGRTTPKSLHCLSMRLTTEYFALKPEDRELPSHQELQDTNLHHVAVLSDNVLSCAVVVDSTVSSAVEPEKIIFHVVTDSLNFAAISMWFLLNPPGKAIVQIQNMDNFDFLSNKYETPVAPKLSSLDKRHTSSFNYLRFYLPDIFPKLEKILLLDHDVVVQKDLTGLWGVDLKGKVNAAVETCRGRGMDTLVNFSDPMVAKRFDVNACVWEFGVNLFDLQQWRQQNLTGVYTKLLELGKERPLLKAGGLPIGWLTFYNQTIGLDRKWHVHGLGLRSTVTRTDIEGAAVLHYNGVRKPWLSTGFNRYKQYWKSHVNFDHPFLQQCNVH